MIHLYVKDIKDAPYDAKIKIDGKAMEIELTDLTSKEVSLIQKDFSNDKYKTFLVAVKGTKARIVEPSRYIQGLQEVFWIFPTMLNMSNVFIIRTGNINPESDGLEMIIEATNVQKDKIEIETTQQVKKELVKVGSDNRVSREKREMLFPSYSLIVNEKEYKHSDNESDIEICDSNEIIYNKDYLDITIKKYDMDFKSIQSKENDNDEIYIESSCGIINATKVKLVNGEASIRLYPMEYEGSATIKIGWSLQRTRNTYDFVLRKADSDVDNV